MRLPSPTTPSRNIVVALALALGIVGCTEELTPEEQTQAKVDAMVDERCDLLASCECTFNPYDDRERCEAEVRSSLEGSVALTAVEGLTIDWQCLYEFWEVLDCRTYAELETSFVIPLRCGTCSVIHGDVPVDEPCFRYSSYQSSDCAPGLQCIDVDDGRRCMDPCETVEGSPCGRSFTHCKEGLYCDQELQECRAYADEGEPCDERRCATGLFCYSATGHCSAPLAENEPCAVYEDECEDDLYCDEALAVCKAAEPIGTPCTAHGGCTEGLCIDDVCTPYPGEGEPCYASSCAVGLECNQYYGLCLLEEPWVCAEWQ